MKPNKIFILTAVVALLSGCLDEKNESYTTMDNYFRDVTQITTGINGCYNPLRTIVQRRDFWEMTEVAADLIYMSGSTVYNANCDVSPARPGVATPIWRYGYDECCHAVRHLVLDGQCVGDELVVFVPTIK